MNAAFRHGRKATHEANNLTPPSMYPRLLSQFPEHDNRGDTPLEMTQLPQNGDLNISHFLYVGRQDWRAKGSPHL